MDDKYLARFTVLPDLYVSNVGYAEIVSRLVCGAAKVVLDDSWILRCDTSSSGLLWLLSLMASREAHYALPSNQRPS